MKKLEEIAEDLNKLTTVDTMTYEEFRDVLSLTDRAERDFRKRLLRKLDRENDSMRSYYEDMSDYDVPDYDEVMTHLGLAPSIDTEFKNRFATGLLSLCDDGAKSAPRELLKKWKTHGIYAPFYLLREYYEMKSEQARSAGSCPWGSSPWGLPF